MNILRCVCGNWLATLVAGAAVSRHRHRRWRIATGEITCEKCGAVMAIRDGRPARELVGVK